MTSTPQVLIKNIIFDFGGVLLDIDYSLTMEAFARLNPLARNIFTQANQIDLFDDFEVGRLSPELFRSRLRKVLEFDGDDRELDTAWNALLLNLPKSRIDFILKLKARYRTFLLSNTNAIHKVEFDRTIARDIDGKYFSSAFEKIFYSHEIGLRKPHPEVFQFVLKENQLVAEETIFIDDSEQHIIGARSLGLQTVHLKPPLRIEDVFTEDLQVQKSMLVG
jgi:putative hydrolase of the HAD superfamily